MTVKQLQDFLAAAPDDAVVCQDDRDYGPCFYGERLPCSGYVKPNDKGEYMSWSDDFKDGFVRAILL